MPIPTSSDLRYRVGFYQRPALPASSPDTDYGNTEDDFPATATFITWGNIIPRLGGESVLADRLTGKNLINIIVRKSATTAVVTTDWIAKNETTGEIFNIRSIIDAYGGTVKHGFYFEMLCEKGVAV